MLNKILKLKGVQELSKKEQKGINGFGTILPGVRGRKCTSDDDCVQYPGVMCLAGYCYRGPF
jgi:hypothetical protein